MLSLQGTSALLLYGLSPSPRIVHPDQAAGARTIVVLGNGAVRMGEGERGINVLNPQSVFNAVEAARLYDLLGHPTIVASGGPAAELPSSEAEVLADALVNLGVDRTDIALESNSMNTWRQALLTAEMLHARGERSIVLVTSPEHMRRAAGAFRKVGFQVVPSASGITYSDPPFFRPALESLQGSRYAIYEYLACGLYWILGRL